MPVDEAEQLYHQMKNMPSLEIKGVDCHIGSQLTELSPFLNALDRLLVLIDRLKRDGFNFDHLDLGGGLGVRYKQEQPPLPHELAAAIRERLQSRPLKLILEPGRAITANAGILATKVEYIKGNGHKRFAIVDGGMNDLLRPSLYGAWHDIIPVHQRSDGGAQVYDVVGPVCETGDFFGKERELNIQQGDLLVIRTAGAYGFTMSSNYNTRPRVAEILVEGSNTKLIRRRETVAELFQHEMIGL